MHDIIDLERRGLPGVYVATVQFVDGAEVQAKALGATPAAVFVQHPIQDRTDAEMMAIADEVLDKLICEITVVPR